MTTESWRPIQGWPRYAVSDCGRVKNLTTGLVLKPQFSKTGYASVELYGDNAAWARFSIHRLVALAFIGLPPDGKPFCCHRNGNPADNSIKNLRWDNQKGNMTDCDRRGEGACHVKLTTGNVQAIRDLIAARELSYAEIGSLFSVSAQAVRNIKKGQTWRHIPDPHNLSTAHHHLRRWASKRRKLQEAA